MWLSTNPTTVANAGAVKFRKDGFDWEKRADGRTVREDHAKLKVAKLNVIYSCYAHLEGYCHTSYAACLQCSIRVASLLKVSTFDLVMLVSYAHDRC